MSLKLLVPRLRLEPPRDDPQYFFERDMAEHAIARLRMLHAVAPDKP